MVVMIILSVAILIINKIYKEIKRERKYKKKVIDEAPADAVIITFEQLKNMYVVAQDAWDLSCLEGEFYVWYFPYDKTLERRVFQPEKVYFKTLRDHNKVEKFADEIAQNKVKLERLKKEAEVAGWFQTDINVYRERYTRELQEQNKKIQDATNRFLERQAGSRTY